MILLFADIRGSTPLAATMEAYEYSRGHKQQHHIRCSPGWEQAVHTILTGIVWRYI